MWFAGSSCDDPGRPPQSIQHAMSYEGGELVTYNCLREGYFPQYALMCIAENGTVSWNASLPMCVGK